MGVNIYSYAMEPPGPPFSATTDDKFNWPALTVAEVDLKDYPDRHEVLGAEIYIDTRLYEGHNVTATFEARNFDTGQLLWSGSIAVPQPSSEGHEWWNWYRVRFWVGHADWEINGPMKVSMKVIVKGSPLPETVKTMQIDVIDTAPPETADVRVDSAPFGAKIFLDGVDTGILTSNWIVVPAGEHSITVKLEGYEDMTKTRVFVAGETIVLTYTLKETPPAEAVIHFTSSPSGASIFVNDISTGWTTPKDYTVDIHYYGTARYELDGYEDVSFPFDVDLGEEKTYHKILTPTEWTLSLRIIDDVTSADIPGALCTFSSKSCTTNVMGWCAMHDTLGFSGTLTVSKRGYETYTEALTMSPGETKTKAIRLTPAEAVIHFTSSPSGASIFVNDISTGWTTPKDYTVDIHYYGTARYELDGYEDVSFPFDVDLGEEKTYHKILTPTAPPPYITKYIGDTVYVNVPVRNIGTLSGTAYVRASLVLPPAITGIDLPIVAIDGVPAVNGLDGTVTLDPGQSATLTFSATIPIGTPIGLYDTVGIARTGPNLTGDVLDEVTESEQVVILL